VDGLLVCQLGVWKLHRILRRAAGAALLAFAVSLLFAARASESGPVVSAWADTLPSPSPTATCSADGGPGCTVGDPTSTPTPGTGSAGDCTWKQGISAVTWIYGDTAPPASSWPWLDAAEYNSVIAWMDSHAPPEVGTPPYLSMGVVFCPDPTVVGVFTVGTLSTPPTAANVLGLWALSQVSWTPPSLGASPPLTAAAVTNLPTYVYLNPGAYQATGTTATVPGGAVSATIVATPVKVVWSTGDGGSVTCPGPGVPYDDAWGNSPAPADSGACTYTYTDTSNDQPGGTYSLSATVWYHATWTSTGAGGAAGDLGLVPGPTVTEQITVDQIASVITSG